LLHSGVPKAFSTSAVANQHSHSTGSTYVVDAAKRKTGWAAVPTVPKVLGLGGLIPFFALSPPVMQAGVLDVLMTSNELRVLRISVFLNLLRWMQVGSFSRA
jgi:hypothetical protein